MGKLKMSSQEKENLFFPHFTQKSHPDKQGKIQRKTPDTDK